MLRTITTKILFENRWSLFFWTLGLLFMTWLTFIFYPSFGQSGSLDSISQSLPPALRGLLGDIASLKTIGGYINSEILSMRIPLLMSIMSIALAVGQTAGDEERGTLQTLLALPVSRTRALSEKYLAVLIMLGVGAFSVWLGLEFGLLSIHDSYSAKLLLEAVVNTWLIMVAFGSVAFCVGAVTGRRGVAIGIGSLFAFGSFFLTSFSDSVEKLKNIGHFTLYHVYTDVNVASVGLNVRDTLILIGSSLILFLVSLLVFNRRDLRN